MEVVNTANLTAFELREFKAVLAEKHRRESQRKIDTFYSTPEVRAGYHIHMKFFQAGAIHRERLFMAANRVGKTEGCGAFETTLHLTGEYPEWWEGRRFKRPISATAAGLTGKQTRDVIQAKLIGLPGSLGTGMIPGAAIQKATMKPGVPDAKDQIWVKHVSGGTSVLTLMSYDQGREVFQGTEKDLIWLDEEPPLSVYEECVVRTMTTDGLVMLTFTPLMGMSDVVRLFMPEGAIPKAKIDPNASQYNNDEKRYGDDDVQDGMRFQRKRGRPRKNT